MKSNPTILNATLTEMIPVMRAACSLPPLSTVELKSVREAWALVLEKTVPSNRVKEMFTLLLQTPRDANDKRSRVIGAPDVRDLWFKIHAEEQDRVRVLSSRTCTACCGKLKITIYNPKFEQDVIVACPFHSAKEI